MDETTAFTAGLYRKMQMIDCIVNTTDEYIALERIHGWSGANWVGMVVWGYLKEIVQWNRIV